MDDMIKCYHYLQRAIGFNLPDIVIVPAILIVFVIIVMMFVVVACNVLFPPVRLLVNKLKDVYSNCMNKKNKEPVRLIQANGKEGEITGKWVAEALGMKCKKVNRQEKKNYLKQEKRLEKYNKLHEGETVQDVQQE